MAYAFLFTQLHLCPSSLFLSFSAFIPSCKEAQHAYPMVLISKGAEGDPQHSPVSMEQKQPPTPCTASTKQQPDPSTKIAVGSCWERWAVFLTNQNKTTAMLHFHNERLKTCLNDSESHNIATVRISWYT